MQWVGVAELRHTAAPGASGVDAYWLTGGAWVADQPLLVNRDFDFSLAMSLEGGVGAGLAASQRHEANRNVAASLAGRVALALPERLVRATVRPERSPSCTGPALAGELRAYAILFGAPEAQLRLVVEHVVDGGVVGRVIAFSEWASLEEETGWTQPDGNRLETNLDWAAAQVAAFWGCVLVQPSGPPRTYRVTEAGGRRRDLTGWTLASSAEAVAVRLQEPANTVAVFAAGLVALPLVKGGRVIGGIGCGGGTGEQDHACAVASAAALAG